MLFIVLSYSRNGYSKDFLLYDHDPGGLLVVLVIGHCVNATEGTMETVHSVEEDGHEVDTSVGCKPEGKSAAVMHPVGLFVAVDSCHFA